MAKNGPQKYPPANRSRFYQDTFGGTSMESNVVVWHSTETRGLPGYRNGAVAPNFTAMPSFRTKRIIWHQHFDFDVSSRALRNLAGGVETNRLNAVQVELVGTCDPKMHRTWSAMGLRHLFTEQLPDWVVRDLAAFVRWAHKEHDVPITSGVTFKRFDSSFGSGNGVRLSHSQWRKFTGHLGHQHVPENLHGDPGKFPMGVVLRRALDAPVPEPSRGQRPAIVPKVHVVVAGQTMFGIARDNGLTLARLVDANPAFKANPAMLPIGTKLVIPAA